MPFEQISEAVYVEKTGLERFKEEVRSEFTELVLATKSCGEIMVVTSFSARKRNDEIIHSFVNAVKVAASKYLEDFKTVIITISVE